MEQPCRSLFLLANFTKQIFVPLERNRTNTLWRTQMTTHLPLFLNKALSRRQSSRQDGTSETLLKCFLQQSQKEFHPLALISVHGSMGLNKQLTDSAPHGTEIIRLNHDLYSFHDKARFDLLFYSLPQGEWKQSALLENLCYCRMLLRPGAKLCLLKNNRAPQGLRPHFSRKKAIETNWLIRAGFTQIDNKKIGDGLTLLCGQRPAQNF